jgi:hypothetical protein
MRDKRAGGHFYMAKPIEDSFLEHVSRAPRETR